AISFSYDGSTVLYNSEVGYASVYFRGDSWVDSEGELHSMGGDYQTTINSLPYKWGHYGRRMLKTLVNNQSFVIGSYEEYNVTYPQTYPSPLVVHGGIFEGSTVTSTFEGFIGDLNEATTDEGPYFISSTWDSTSGYQHRLSCYNTGNIRGID